MKETMMFPIRRKRSAAKKTNAKPVATGIVSTPLFKAKAHGLGANFQADREQRATVADPACACEVEINGHRVVIVVLRMADDLLEAFVELHEPPKEPKSA